MFLVTKCYLGLDLITYEVDQDKSSKRKFMFLCSACTFWKMVVCPRLIFNLIDWVQFEPTDHSFHHVFVWNKPNICEVRSLYMFIAFSTSTTSISRFSAKWLVNSRDVTVSGCSFWHFQCLSTDILIFEVRRTQFYGPCIHILAF